jgi:hypothetical protein
MIRPVPLSVGRTADSGSGLWAAWPADSLSRNSFRKRLLLRILPLRLTMQYANRQPYGWNDGSLRPSVGYQQLLSPGLHAHLGPISVQLQPEWVLSQNKKTEPFFNDNQDSLKAIYYDRVVNRIDAPMQFATGWKHQVLPGQSSVRLNYKKLSAGISTENLWWGPGIRNAILMSNHAPGFPHLTFNTTAPVQSVIGSFEGQVISGRLKASGVVPADTGITAGGRPIWEPKRADGNRYLNGMVATWQPKWTPGLHVGFARVVYQYWSDVPSNLTGYLPVMLRLFKSRLGNEDSLQRDQMLSLFFRLQLPGEQAEVYGEWARNDHSWNFSDLLGEPEHSRAYLIGLRKMFDRPGKQRKFELMLELTQLQMPSTRLVRAQESWYAHYQVRHGYTHLGQVVGAGIGPGSNSQTFAAVWIKNGERFGISLERVVHDNDFFYDAASLLGKERSHWTDVTLNLQRNWNRKWVLFDARLALVRTLNFHWQRKNLYSLFVQTAVIFPF